MILSHVCNVADCVFSQMNEMEAMRIDDELHKQKISNIHHSFNRYSKDSGVVDLDLLKPGDPGVNRLSAPEVGGLKKSALSNSLIELSDSMHLLTQSPSLHYVHVFAL